MSIHGVSSNNISYINQQQKQMQKAISKKSEPAVEERTESAAFERVEQAKNFAGSRIDIYA